jgi:hypothetical protein
MPVCRKKSVAKIEMTDIICEVIEIIFKLTDKFAKVIEIIFKLIDKSQIPIDKRDDFRKKCGSAAFRGFTVRSIIPS